ncbi:MAG TPA: dCMP deaminase family protein [Methanoregulaceae archaeon]|nr:dCMP deaminase family protein [Methanoregulaceae archaeon]
MKPIRDDDLSASASYLDTPRTRASEHAWALALAWETAKRSTCLRRHVGAVLLDGAGHVIATGYNGAPAGTPHCETCLREELAVPAGERYELCRAVHAEANALLQAGRSARGATIVLATINPVTGGGLQSNDQAKWPCLMCARLLINAGVEAVVVRVVNSRQGFEIDDPRSILAWRERGLNQGDDP